MRTFFHLAIISILTTNALGQEVKYKLKAPVNFISIDSISIVRPGQKIKLDFKTNEQKVRQYPPAYPSLRGARRVLDDIHWYGDTITLTIDGEKITFIERKGKTVDYYLFGVECLISNSFKQGHSLVIPYSTIQDVKTDSILFRLTIDLYKQRKRDWKKVNSKTIDIWINKGQLDGVLISEIEDE